ASLTHTYNSFNRVISRITDSVNCVALCEPVSLDMKAPRAGDSTLRGLLAFLRCALLLHDPRLALCGRLLRGRWRGRRRTGFLCCGCGPLVRHGRPRIIVCGRGSGRTVEPAIVFGGTEDS